MNFSFRFYLLMAAFFVTAPLYLLSQKLNDTFFINNSGEYALYKHLYIYESNKKISPQFVYDSLKSSDFIRLYPNTSFNNNTSLTLYYWLVVTLKNNLAEDDLFYYCLNSPGLNIVNAYQKQGSKNFKLVGKAGFYVPIDLRQNKSHDADFYFLIKKGETDNLILEIENPSAQDAFFLPKLFDALTYKSKQENYSLIIGIITGIMLTTFLLNIFFAISLKEKIHYLYALYVLCLLYEILILEGLAENYMGMGNYRLAEMIIHIFPSVCIFLMTKIMQWFLNQKRSNSYFQFTSNAVSHVVIMIAILFIIDYFIHLNSFFSNLLQIAQAVFIGLQLLLLILSAIEKTIQNYKLAWLYLCASVWLLIGLFEYVMAFLRVDDVEIIKIATPTICRSG